MLNKYMILIQEVGEEAAHGFWVTCKPDEVNMNISKLLSSRTFLEIKSIMVENTSNGIRDEIIARI